jgi:cysteine desulfurase
MEWIKKIANDRIYLDHAARTPVRPHIARMIGRASGKGYGNPSAIHAEGRRARAMLSDARTMLARRMGIRAEEVLFTSGGTESNNLALRGVLEALKQRGRAYADMEVITTAIEHPSILAVLDAMRAQGVAVTEIPVDDEGIIDEAAFTQALNPKTVLVTFAYANSEIGVVQDVKRLTRAVRLYRKEQQSEFPYFHLDASQAPLYLPCDMRSLGVDLMTLDAQKFCGPASVGILARHTSVPLSQILFGGSQEEGLRPGTENAPAILGAALAFEEAQEKREERAARVAALRDFSFEALSAIEGVVVNGSRSARIANNVNISIPGIDGEYAAVVLDEHGIAVSTKSACSGRSGSGSSVIYALGGDDERALSTLRATLGEETTKRNIMRFVRVLERHVMQTRASLDQRLKK